MVKSRRMASSSTVPPRSGSTGVEPSAGRSNAVMLELLTDAFLRLESVGWVKRLGLSAPKLISGNAIDILQQLTADVNDVNNVNFEKAEQLINQKLSPVELTQN